jgi:hypothetical protein
VNEELGNPPHLGSIFVQSSSMKPIILLLFTFIGIKGFAQDTTNLVKSYDGSKSYWLFTKTDSVIKTFYPGGKKESIRPLKKYQVTGTYTRWYENGKLMWEKEMVNGKQEGKTVFYNEKGIKIAELNYAKGEIADTVFIKEGIHLLLGKITSTSRVYGGMELADGTSNISESSGPYMNLSMYAAKIDSLKKPELIQNFRTDYNGDFIITLPQGKIGFFLKTTDINTLLPDEYAPPMKAWSSGHDGWNMNKPLQITDEKIISFFMHHYSEGYAP